jgi:hypothetical protein
MGPIDLLSALVGDELQRRQDCLPDRRHKLARFRDHRRFGHAQTAADDLLALITRRYERASTLLTSNRPMDDWQAARRHGGGDCVTRSHHAHVLKCGPRSWRTKLHGDLPPGEGVR